MTCGHARKRLVKQERVIRRVKSVTTYHDVSFFRILLNQTCREIIHREITENSSLIGAIPIKESRLWRQYNRWSRLIKDGKRVWKRPLESDGFLVIKSIRFSISASICSVHRIYTATLMPRDVRNDLTPIKNSLSPPLVLIAVLSLRRRRDFLWIWHVFLLDLIY